jgi:hypothetical protein
MIRALALALSLLPLAQEKAQEEPKKIVLVELYTSQG